MESVNSFYRDNKPLLELIGFLLVSAGLFLNLKSDNSISGRSIHELQFFLLALSCFLLVQLGWQSVEAFIRPFLDKDIPKNLKEEEQISQMTSRIAGAIFALISFFFFTANLFVYLFLNYKHDVLWILISIFSFFILRLIIIFVFKLKSHRELFKTLASIMVVFGLCIFLISVPFSAYLVLYFKSLISYSWLLRGGLILMLLTFLCEALFFNKYVK